MINWLKGFARWDFWLILAFLVALMVVTAVTKGQKHGKVMGDYPFINRSVA